MPDQNLGFIFFKEGNKLLLGWNSVAPIGNRQKALAVSLEEAVEGGEDFFRVGPIIGDRFEPQMF